MEALEKISLGLVTIAIEVPTDATQLVLPFSLSSDFHYFLTIPEYSDAIWQFHNLQMQKIRMFDRRSLIYRGIEHKMQQVISHKYQQMVWVLLTICIVQNEQYNVISHFKVYQEDLVSQMV